MQSQLLLTDIASDTLQGLSAYPKYLLSKYLYDDTGSSIFQDIMQMPEYYLTNCEFEIFTTHRNQITKAFHDNGQDFDLIELGSGDGLKTKILLQGLIEQSTSFQYIPVDISKKANNELVKSLKRELPSLDVAPRTGDYFQKIKELNGYSGLQKVILFLGSNIGNFSDEEIELFFSRLSTHSHKGDKLLIGFDLKKSPHIIMQAYNDPHGHTRRFNLNHLIRLNRELNANFDVDNFEHHTEYNPLTGEVKSFLVSKADHAVDIGDLEQTFHFGRWEPVFMELSRKFDYQTIESIAVSHGFKVQQQFTDQREFFVDSLWVKE